MSQKPEGQPRTTIISGHNGYDSSGIPMAQAREVKPIITEKPTNEKAEEAS